MGTTFIFLLGKNVDSVGWVERFLRNPTSDVGFRAEINLCFELLFSALNPTYILASLRKEKTRT